MRSAHCLRGDEYARKGVERGDNEHDPEREPPTEPGLRDITADNGANHYGMVSWVYPSQYGSSQAYQVPSMVQFRKGTMRTLAPWVSTCRLPPLPRLSKLVAISQL